jgi:hypothetical protein
MTEVNGRLRPWVPGNTFLQTVYLPVIDGASPPFIAQNPLLPESTSWYTMLLPTRVPRAQLITTLLLWRSMAIHKYLYNQNCLNA